MTDDELLDEISDVAFKKLAVVGNQLEQLEEPYKTVAIIFSAQGVMDNGGMVYFFENDWPNNPPYSIFADAYERIGRAEAAQVIRDAVGTFGVANPEFNKTARKEYMKSNQESNDGMVWNDCICGDNGVWVNLASWIRTHPDFQV